MELPVSNFVGDNVYFLEASQNSTQRNTPFFAHGTDIRQTLVDKSIKILRNRKYYENISFELLILYILVKDDAPLLCFSCQQLYYYTAFHCLHFSHINKSSCHFIICCFVNRQVKVNRFIKLSESCRDSNE